MKQDEDKPIWISPRIMIIQRLTGSELRITKYGSLSENNSLFSEMFIDYLKPFRPYELKFYFLFVSNNPLIFTVYVFISIFSTTIQ